MRPSRKVTGQARLWRTSDARLRLRLRPAQFGHQSCRCCLTSSSAAPAPMPTAQSYCRPRRPYVSAALLQPQTDQPLAAFRMSLLEAQPCPPRVLLPGCMFLPPEHASRLPIIPQAPLIVRENHAAAALGTNPPLTYTPLRSPWPWPRDPNAPQLGLIAWPCCLATPPLPGPIALSPLPWVSTHLGHQSCCCLVPRSHL